VFDTLRDGLESRQTRKDSDENGVHHWGLEFRVDGGVALLLYVRKGEYGVEKPGATGIWVEYYDNDGYPVPGGTSVAKFIDGAWKILDTDAIR
jgi:hypothetical protein